MAKTKEPMYAFNNVDVEIMGRNELENLSQYGFKNGTYVISITDTDAPSAHLANRPAGILRLTFDDVGNEEYPISCHEMDDADAEDLKIIDLISNPITVAQGTQIARFIDENASDMEHLICQCEMGQSRSAAVAAATVNYYTGTPCGIFDDSRYYPNRLVYHTVLNALAAQKADTT